MLTKADIAIITELLDQKLDQKLTEKLEQNSATLFGQMTRYFDHRLETRIEPIEAKLDRIQTTLDADSKRIEIDEHERAAIISEQKRHRGWIGQLAKSTNTKLVPEQ